MSGSAVRLINRHARRTPHPRLLRRPQIRPHRCRATAQSAELSNAAEEVPPGCSRYTVELTRPLGLVLEEDGQGGIKVAQVLEGGFAARTGEIAAGDALISTSGIMYTRESEYLGSMVRSGEQRVTLNVRGEAFDTIMAAIGTHKAGQRVVMTFQRC